MSIDRLAKDVRKGIEDNKGILEVPVKLLFQILFKGKPANQNALHQKLLDMKTKYNDIDYLGVLSRNDPKIRFYKRSVREEKLLKDLEERNGRDKNDAG